jgi:hypothetical protein
MVSIQICDLRQILWYCCVCDLRVVKKLQFDMPEVCNFVHGACNCVFFWAVIVFKATLVDEKSRRPKSYQRQLLFLVASPFFLVASPLFSKVALYSE